jgi:hypothetical protein
LGRGETYHDTINCANGPDLGMGRTWKTLERSRRQDTARGLAGPTPRPASLSEARSPFSFTQHVLAKLYYASPPSINVDLIRGPRFIHPNYITRPQTPLHIQSIIIIARGVPRKDNLRASPNLGRS